MSVTDKAADHQQDAKQMFLDLTACGYPRVEAAEAAGLTYGHITKICSRRSDAYDPDFAEQYKELTKPGGEYETALIDRLETAVIQRAIKKSDRLAEKLLMIYSKRWEIHKPQAAVQMQIRTDDVKMLFANMSDETLKRVLDEYDQAQQKKLPAPSEIEM